MMGKLFGKYVVLLVVFVFVLLFSQLVHASDFIVDRSNINYRISPDQVAEYNITIINLGAEETRYSLMLDVGSALNWVSTPSSVTVPGNDQKTVRLLLSPSPKLAVGVYEAKLIVRTGSQQQSVSLPVHLSYDGFFFDFVPNIETKVTIQDRLDPRESARVRVDIRNRNPLRIENAVLRVSSELFRGEQIINISPGPYSLDEVISKELIFSLDPLQSPGDYEVAVRIFYPRLDRFISSEQMMVSVLEYSSTPSKIETSKRLFVTTRSITVENFGNKDALPEVMLSTSWLSKVFSKSSLPAEVKKVNGDLNYVWQLHLEPTQKKEIFVTTNYWPLVIVLLLVLFVIFLYFKLRSPILLSKEVAIIDGDKSEGSSELKVRLFLRNRTGNSINAVTVSDKVRGITDYVESKQLGHVLPSRTTKTTKKGTILFWDIDELEAYEERIFTYKLRSRLKVVGNLTLPKASAKFETKKGKERKILSDKPYFKKLKKKFLKNKNL